MIPIDVFGGVVTSPQITPPSFASMALTGNQQAVALAFDRIDASATGNVAGLLSQIQGLTSPAAQQAALASMSGEVYGTLQTLGLQIGDRSLRTIANRIVNNDIFLNDGEPMLLGQINAPNPSDSSDQIVRGQPSMPSPSAWIQGFGGRGDLSSNGNAAGTGYRQGGFAVGMDLGRDESGAVGITGSTDSMAFHTGLGDVGSIQSYQIGIYAVKRLENVYGFTVLNYGHNNDNVTRNIQIGGGPTSSSSFSGNQFGTYNEIGGTVNSGILRLQPFAGIQYLLLSNGSAFENGGGGTALSIGSSSISTLQTHLGTRLICATWRDRNGFDWTPYLSTRWISELLGEQAFAQASLSGAPGASWVVAGNQSSRNFGMLSPGVTVRATEGISFFANYDQVFGDRFQSYTASGGVLFQF